MERIQTSVQEVAYQARQKSQPASAPKPIKDYPSSAKEWQTFRAKLNGVAVDSVCPECAGLGYLKDSYTRLAVRCLTCSETERKSWLLDHCGLEAGQLDYSLGDWRLGNWKDTALVKQRQQAKSVIEQAIAHRRGLYTFWGDFGAGKTLALQIVANETRTQMVESYYVPLAFVLDHLRSLFHRREEWSHYWQRLLDVPVLCLDEVTRFYETDWAVERLWMLADMRYSRRETHLTVFATNNDPRQSLPATEAIGYLYSRMREGMLAELRGDMRQAPSPREEAA